MFQGSVQTHIKAYGVTRMLVGSLSIRRISTWPPLSERIKQTGSFFVTLFFKIQEAKGFIQLYRWVWEMTVLGLC